MGAASPRARRSLLVAALALSFAGTLLLPATAKSTIYPQKSIAGVKLGMTKSMVRARLGRPVFVVRRNAYRTFHYRDLQVKFRTGRVVYVRTTRSTERTTTNVGVGSTERKVRRGVTGVVCDAYLSILRRCRVGTETPWTRVTDFLLYGGHVYEVSLSVVPDKTPPTQPGGLAVTGATKTSISLAWSPSTDDVGVTAYDIARNGFKALSTTTTSASIHGLACGSSYMFEVGARDKFGNRSAKASITASTSACPATGDLFMSPLGSDVNPCTQVAPCLSLNRAYRRAAPSQVVELEPGDYPGMQIIYPDASKTSAEDVVFRVRDGLSASFTVIRVRSRHLELRGLHAGYWYVHPTAADVTFRNMDVNKFFIRGGSDISVIGGDVGPLANSDSQVSSYSGTVPTNVLIDGVYFHDAIKTDPAAHTECLQFGAGVNVIIRNSIFARCSDHDIFIRSWGSVNKSPHPLYNFTIENNVFGKTLRGYYSLRLGAKKGWPCDNFVIRNNSALQNIYSDCAPRNVAFVGNIQPTMSSYMCTGLRFSQWDYNLYESGTRCGEHDIVGDPRYADRASLDLRPLTGSAAIDRANPSSFPPADADGRSRPVGAAPDAGAFEAE